MTKTLEIDTTERERYERDGFLVRESVFTAKELEEIAAACEDLCDRVVAQSNAARKVDVSQYYVFEHDRTLNIMVKWEPGAREVVQGLEPLVHLDPVLDRCGAHPGLVEPVRQLLGFDEVALFTEKLNVKRAGVGGAYALHRDLPYWLPDADDAYNMITVVIALDDTTAENGALEVLPGSHHIESPPHKDSELEFERNELDPDRMDTSEMVPVELSAGSAVFFGPKLIHRSAPNRSAHDRRALLYTYQRRGLRDQRDINREWFEQHESHS